MCGEVRDTIWASSLMLWVIVFCEISDGVAVSGGECCSEVFGMFIGESK